MAYFVYALLAFITVQYIAVSLLSFLEHLSSQFPPSILNPQIKGVGAKNRRKQTATLATPER